jgi:hypothetical protein
MMCFESADENNVEEWLQSDVCEPGSQHMTDTGIVNAAMKQKEEEEDGEDESEEEGESSECVSRSMVLQCVDTLLDIMGQRGFKYSDITAARKIHTAIRRSLNS